MERGQCGVFFRYSVLLLLWYFLARLFGLALAEHETQEVLCCCLCCSFAPFREVDLLITGEGICLAFGNHNSFSLLFSSSFLLIIAVQVLLQCRERNECLGLGFVMVCLRGHVLDCWYCHSVLFLD